MDHSDTLPDNRSVEASFGIKEDWQHFSKTHQVLLSK
jgi:hypothetical protein